MTAPADGQPAAGHPLAREPITVVLADAHEMVRTGLRLLLEREEDITVLADVAGAADAGAALRASDPIVLVLDPGLPGAADLAPVAVLHEAHPDTAIVIVAVQADPELAGEALRLGAGAYVLKSAPAAELVRAIRLVAGGGTYLSPELGARLAGWQRPGGARPGPDELSRRELEVLRLIAGGYTNAEIAGQLYLSVRTVESHRARIQHKLGISGRAELVAHARALGLA